MNGRRSPCHDVRRGQRAGDVAELGPSGVVPPAGAVRGPGTPAARAASPRRRRAARRSPTLAARCDINRATAWRLLGTLEAHSLVERDPATNRYRIGLAMIRMSAAAGLRRTGAADAARSSSASRTQTGETADLAVAGQHGVTYVGEVAPPSVMAINWLAREVPLHATSTGKAFLAWLPADEARGLLDDSAAAASPTPR